MGQKCINCGEHLEPYYSKQGAVLFVCPNLHITVKRQKLMSYGFKFCEAQLQPLTINPEEAILLYADYKSLKKSFDAIAKILTLTQLRRATHNTISDVQLLKNVNLALLLGINENILCELFENALKLGYAVGAKSQYAIESLSKGLARQSRLILDNIGISFRSETANAWFKTQKKLETLNAKQRKEAWKTFAVMQIKLKTEHLEIVKAKATQDQLKAKIENQKTAYGRDLR